MSALTLIPGLNSIYAIFNRAVDRNNRILANRQARAKEVSDNIEQWVKLLTTTFKSALDAWEANGRQKALAIIDELIRESIEIRYESIRASSPILKNLDEDQRFSGFASAAAAFYASAVNAKRIVYGEIERNPGEYLSAYETDTRIMLETWLVEIKRHLSFVRVAYDNTRILDPK